jgi:hypothetical protein
MGSDWVDVMPAHSLLGMVVSRSKASRQSESNRRPSHDEEDLQRRIRSLPASLSTRPPALRAKFLIDIRGFVPRVMPRPIGADLVDADRRGARRGRLVGCEYEAGQPCSAPPVPV